jgi:hypothetical protein
MTCSFNNARIGAAAEAAPEPALWQGLMARRLAHSAVKPRTAMEQTVTENASSQQDELPYTQLL